MSGGGRGRARRLTERLSSRDRAILATLRDLRTASGNQLGRLHVDGDHPIMHARKTRAALQRLTELRLIIRLERRVGGVRSGSQGFCYVLSGLGQAVLDLEEPAPRRHRRVVETKPAFHNHALAVTETFVQVVERCRSRRAQLLEWSGEPRCWRRFAGSHGQVLTLKPDSYARLAMDDYELSTFLELDLDTESLPTITRKLDLYVAYWRSGIEQHRHGVFPAVWWLVPSLARLDAISSAVRRLPEDVRDLFTGSLIDEAADVLTQPNLEGGAR
ncbi:hypothetical protein DMH04_25520 [Kibdelosporangium aridum]|uniref:Replication-relaxation n=1 Tax=Kibdelosporangium aridum TaxID=2030 RepID=A0A428Z665_KIBAR|nr:replication-relaxation family protein [Kibdelosporangium aridum]RSM82554.1 hypothetical protein DMH04_25520 [Kibdelosporangium aridum]